MYAKPTCPTPLKILLVVVIVVELAAIGLLLAGRAGASEGRDSAVEASASTTPAPTDTPAAPAASDGGETAGGDKASSEPVTLTVTFAGDCTLGTDINYENERSFNSRWQAEEGDATYFLRNVADLFGSDDLTVVNMEGALTEGGERADKKFAFRGKPEYIINYLTFVAEELREYMAKLGVRTVDELVGRTDLLRVKPAAPGSRAAELDLDCILHNPAIANSNVHFIKEDSYDFHLENTLDMKVLMKKFKLGSKAPQNVSLNVSNVDRAFGAIFGSEITRKYGNDLPDDVYTVHCTGAGGQSFGAFIPSGLTLELVGDCNDYMGKGLSGGKIVVRPPQGIDFKPEENIITGNVALYGATSGKAFISGVAGERFCVRNSGATAVVEGVGDHGCEYMTGGTVVVLGQTGKNFAAGMTGGIAYVLDENWDFYQRVNKETVSLEPVEHKYDVATLKELIRAHVEATGSPRGKEILDNFSAFLPKFKKVLPYDYDRMLRVIASVEERGLDGEQAQIEAFYAVQKHK